ncbi:hypothetical protein [Epilithonimonas zeae]|uniref:hypothetical protein n=1 Tax=Epilithonimonas zeae TaxID=1416779 RepID=UPI0020100214|nr:hypothetical protein [Epilithonimonas zeae]UQB68726.1 hypothetical protein KI430_17220 [Epilithonimonas zeae]
MMKIIKIGFILSALSLFLLNCKTAAQNTTITSVSYTHTAGRGGRTFINATKDSLESNKTGGRFEDYPVFKKKIDKKDWDKIVSDINISLLEKTQSGKARGYYDGPDHIYRITTTEKEYELINVPENSEGYKQIEKLKNNLDNLLKKY